MQDQPPLEVRRVAGGVRPLLVPPRRNACGSSCPATAVPDPRRRPDPRAAQAQGPRSGMDVARQVEAVGPNVTRCQPGDAVFGWCDGAFAEYACAPEDHFAPKPTTLSFEQAGAVPISGFAALQALRDEGAVQAGQQVLVIGAAGGVGPSRCSWP